MVTTGAVGNSGENCLSLRYQPPHPHVDTRQAPEKPVRKRRYETPRFRFRHTTIDRLPDRSGCGFLSWLFLDSVPCLNSSFLDLDQLLTAQSRARSADCKSTHPSTPTTAPEHSREAPRSGRRHRAGPRRGRHIRASAARSATDQPSHLNRRVGAFLEQCDHQLDQVWGGRPRRRRISWSTSGATTALAWTSRRSSSRI